LFNNDVTSRKAFNIDQVLSGTGYLVFKGKEGGMCRVCLICPAGNIKIYYKRRESIYETQ